MVNRVTNKHLLKIAESAVRLAGDELKSSREFLVKIESELHRDIKIKGDKVSEKILINYLKEHSPFKIISEESYQYDNSFSDKEPMWIVDPLDGSLNYSRGIPLCCISVGLWIGYQPILGVIFDFNNDKMFLGVMGEGAWLNNKEIEVGSISQKEKAVLCTGFPVNSDFETDSIKQFIMDIRQYKKVRLLGSAALSLVYVASGKVDAYYEKDIMLWDIAGGLAILLGAGGTYKIEKGKKENTFNVYASNYHMVDSF